MIEDLIGFELPGLGSRFMAPGGVDDASAMQNAVTAGGTIRMGPGAFLWNSSVPNLGLGGIEIIGSGRARTTIKLSANAPRAFDCDSASNTDQTVADITIRDLTIDAQNLSGLDGHCLLGNKNTLGLRTSFARIRLLRVRVINLTTENPASHNRQGVWLGSQHTAAAQTQSTLTDILIDDLVIEGGNSGVVIVAPSSGASQSNAFIDRLTIGYLYHSTNASTTSNSAALQVGQNAYCGTVKLGRIQSVGSGDVGVEVDNCRDLHVESVTATDPHGVAMLVANLGWTLGSTALPSQSSKIEHITLLASNAQVGGQAFGIRTVNGALNPPANPYGEVKVGSIHVSSSRTTGAPPGAFTFNGTQANLLDIGLIDYEATQLNDTTTGQQYQEALVQPSGTSRVRIGMWRSKLAGTYSAGHILPFLVQSNTGSTATLTLEIDGIEINHAVTALAEDSFIQLLGTGGGTLTIAGHIRGLKTIAAGTQASGAIRVDNSTNVTIRGRLLLDDLDFSGMSGGTEIVWVGTTTAGVSTTKNSINARVTNVRYQNGQIGQAPITEAINAAPWSGTSPSTWINDSGVDQVVNLRGGTVTIVATTASIGGTSGNVGSQSPCSGVFVASGGTCTVTFSVAANDVRVPLH